MQSTNPDVQGPPALEVVEPFDVPRPDLRSYQFDNGYGASVAILHYPDATVFELGVVKRVGDWHFDFAMATVVGDGYSQLNGFIHLMDKVSLQKVLHRIRALTAPAEV